jgi:nucleolar protein 16
MANPRQRRKSRSGTAKVSHSRASIKNKHKVIVKGPSVLVENWDKKKTVRQKYVPPSHIFWSSLAHATMG